MNEKPSISHPEHRVSCRVPSKLKRRLQRAAKIMGVDESDVVRMALNSAVLVSERKKAA